MTTNIIEELELRHTKRYTIQLRKIVRNEYTFYVIEDHHIGRNAKWYHSNKTEYTIIKAYNTFYKKLKLIQQKTEW